MCGQMLARVHLNKQIVCTIVSPPGVRPERACLGALCFFSWPFVHCLTTVTEDREAINYSAVLSERGAKCCRGSAAVLTVPCQRALRVVMQLSESSF